MAMDFIKQGVLKSYFGSKILIFLLGINVIIAIIAGLTALMGGPNGLSSMENLLALPASFNEFLVKPWTILTYMVTQFSLLHLLFNMLWLYWFGKILVYERSEKMLLFTYLGGGVFAGLCYMTAASLSGAIPGATLSGASGAVLAVMTAVATLLPYISVRLFLLGEINIKWLAAACVVLSFIGTGETNIDSAAAHAGGALFGLIFAFIIKKGRNPLTNGINRFIEKTGSQFKKTISPPPQKNPKATVEAMAGKLCDSERLDILLDKIRQSGYASLSEREKKELNAISNRL